MKKILFINLLVLLISIRTKAQENQTIELKIETDLNQEGIISGLGDNISIDEKRNGKKIVFEGSEDNLNLNTFSIEHNAIFIKDVLNILRVTNKSNKELQVMLTISDKNFTNNFIGCGCNDFVYNVIELYKQKWEYVYLNLKMIDIPTPISDHDSFYIKISNLLIKIRGHLLIMEALESNVNRDFDRFKELDDMVVYVTSNPMLENLTNLNRMSNELEELNRTIINYLSFVKLFKNKN